MQYNFNIKNDKMVCNKISTPFTGNVNTYTCVFEIKTDLENLSWFCVFKRKGEAYVRPIINNECFIPGEVLLSEGVIKIGCYATNLNEDDYKRISTNWVYFKSLEGAYSEASVPEIPEPSVWEELVLKGVPIIGENGNWYIYDISVGDFVDSGIKAQGDTGKSAYEVAVENGFKGTEEEWLESLKGVTVDDKMSSTSENPVQNKVVSEHIAGIVNNLQGGINLAYNTALQKQEKLTDEQVNNIDDIPNIKQEVEKKQDNLISGTNIKTLNGQSILGEGNIEIQADYELIMKIIVGYSVLTAKPDDWESNYTSYYKNTGTLKEPIYTALTAFEEWAVGKYYERDEEGTGVLMIKNEPDGKEFSFKSIYFYSSNLQATNNTWGRISLYNKPFSYNNQIMTEGFPGMMSTSAKEFQFSITPNGNGASGVINTGFIKSGGSHSSFIGRSIREKNTLPTIIKGFEFGVTDANVAVMKSDMELYIYGVRA